MPGDLVISDPSVEPAPKDYTVPASQRFVVKQVQALFTDNGAAGDWLPALEVVSDAGIVTGRYVGESVTAGDGQEVTWFPLGRRGSAVSTPGLSVGVFTGTSNGASPWTWNTVNSNDTALYSIDGGDATKARLAQGGTYLVGFQYNANVVIITQFRFAVTLFDNSGNAIQLQFVADWDDASAGDPAQINYLFGNGFLTPGGDTDAPYYVQLNSTPAGAGGVATMVLTRVSPLEVV